MLTHRAALAGRTECAACVAPAASQGCADAPRLVQLFCGPAYLAARLQVLKLLVLVQPAKRGTHRQAIGLAKPACGDLSVITSVEMSQNSSQGAGK